MQAAALEHLFFDGVHQRTSKDGTTYMAFRIEVEVSEPDQSYALTHLRVSVAVAHDAVARSLDSKKTKKALQAALAP